MSDDQSVHIRDVEYPTRVDIHSDTKTADLAIEDSEGSRNYDYAENDSQVIFTIPAGEEEPADDENWHLRSAWYDGSLENLQSETVPTLKYKIV